MHYAWQQYKNGDDMPRSIEKREFPRVPISVPLRYKDFSAKPSGENKSVSRNISQGGISFTTNDFVPLSNRLVLELDIPAFQEPVRAITKIAWIRKLPVGGRYSVGGQFVEIRRSDLVNLQKTINVLNLA